MRKRINMKKGSILLMLGLGIATLAQAQNNTANVDGIEWKEWANRDDTGARQQKTMIYLYTNWCAWCKRMEDEVYQNAEVSRLINRHFAAVKFNGESREPQTYRGETYNYVKDGRVSYHQLAAKWLNGRLSFPSVVFLDENGVVIQAISGPRTVEQMEQVLIYFGENHYKTTPWSSFQRNFRPPTE